jgi:acetylornithine deacetylase
MNRWSTGSSILEAVSRNGSAAAGFREWFEGRKGEIFDALLTYLEIDTTSPNEANAEAFLHEYFAGIGYSVDRSGRWELVEDHDDRSPHPRSSCNNVAWVAEEGNAARLPRLIINAHVDVVPPLPGQGAVRVEADGMRVEGRGSCDTKGNLVVLVETLRYLKDAGLRPRFALTVHLPSEEEIGGNGTLALALSEADATTPAVGALCLEPTRLHTFLGHRGCLGYRLTIQGRAVHMGASDTGVDPILVGAQMVLALNALEDELVDEAAHQPYFKWTSRPCQVNVGRIEAGEWSGSVAQQCTIVGDVGVPPSSSLEEMASRLRQLPRSITRPTGFRTDWDFHAGLRNDPYVAEASGPFADLDARCHPGHSGAVWNVSCDGRHYHRVLGIPTAIFGAGSLSDAHTASESLDVEEMSTAMTTLADWLAAE